MTTEELYKQVDKQVLEMLRKKYDSLPDFLKYDMPEWLKLEVEDVENSNYEEWEEN